MSDSTDNDLKNTIGGVIHGETRILTASLTIDEMFSDREKFREVVRNHIQDDLKQFGLTIKNANISEMQDLPGNSYFEFRKQKAIQGANNEARVEVAEAKRMGDIGEFTKQADAEQQKATISAITAKIKNERDKDIADSNKDLAVAKAMYTKESSKAELEAKMAVEIRNAELVRELEAKKVQQMMETLRAKDFAQANVMAECKIKEAEGEAVAKKTLADAILYSEQKKAEGLNALLKAQADGVDRLVQASRGDTGFAQFYLANNSGLFVELSKQGAMAVQGLKPNITIVNGGGDSDPYKSIRDVTTILPPYLKIFEKNGYMVPDWLLKKSNTSSTSTASTSTASTAPTTRTGFVVADK